MQLVFGLNTWWKVEKWSKALSIADFKVRLHVLNILCIERDSPEKWTKEMKTSSFVLFNLIY